MMDVFPNDSCLFVIRRNDVDFSTLGVNYSYKDLNKAKAMFLVLKLLCVSCDSLLDSRDDWDVWMHLDMVTKLYTSDGDEIGEDVQCLDEFFVKGDVLSKNYYERRSTM